MGSAANPAQDDLPFMSLNPHHLFPGRTVLRVEEVAKALAVTTQHVRDLIEEGKMAAINISGSPITPGNITAAERAYMRIPVSAFDHFVKQNKTV